MYAYICPACGAAQTRIVTMNERDSQPCFFCENIMVRQPSAPTFTVKGFNAANGYSK